RHPAKKSRPVASGALPVRTAAFAALILGVAGIALSFLINIPFALAAAAYATLVLAYTFFLKRLVIIDVFAIASGFVLRAVAGAVAVEVPISNWLLICVILLSLFLALAKRRQELVAGDEQPAAHRLILSEYSPLLLDQMISVVTAATVVCYSLYTLSPETMAKFGSDEMKYTIPFVLYGIFRYLYLIYKKQAGARPEAALLTDAWLLADILLYIMTVWFIIYRVGKFVIH
ncbi:MAG: UbiA family prenyltransferase, partial [Candidatus Edwardsbacteria bacterium]|nr:UbiA family prenyltransferase [Candidatus Edwardsbacteria bacterium]